MKALILYDSEFGNTEHIAHVIAQTLNETGEAEAMRVDHAHPSAIAGVDLLILGSPTQRWQLTPRMKAFLDRVPTEVLSGVAVACFDTRFAQPAWLTGSASKGIAKSIQRIGETSVVDRESFLVEGTEGPLASGELERARNWANHLRHKVQGAQMATLIV
jgi:flavodoxin